MLQSGSARAASGEVHQAPPRPVVVEPDAGAMRDFILRQLRRGTVRVIPGKRGRLVLIPTLPTPGRPGGPARRAEEA